MIHRMVYKRQNMTSSHCTYQKHFDVKKNIKPESGIVGFTISEFGCWVVYIKSRFRPNVLELYDLFIQVIFQGGQNTSTRVFGIGAGNVTRPTVAEHFQRYLKRKRLRKH